MLRIKICGITCLEDAQLACEAGADAIGFIFYEGSPRYIAPHTAADIAARLPAHVTRVGVFVNTPPEVIQQLLQNTPLDVAQLHGEYSLRDFESFAPHQVIAVARVGAEFKCAGLTVWQQRAAAILLDTYRKDAYGGTGATFNWQTAIEANTYGRIILAGGLTPENVRQAADTVAPYALDISSGVEAQPGRKDPAKVRQVFQRLQEFRTGWRPDAARRFPWD